MVKHAPVAVIIPCYCSAHTVSRAVDSVAEQTQRPAELWLVDDASPDGGQTRQVLARIQRQYAGHFEVHCHNLSHNGGPSVARNAAWDKTAQPFVAFLDADDTWAPRKMEVQYRWMSAHDAVALTGSAFHLGPVEVAGNQAAEAPEPCQVTPFRALLATPFCTSSVMMCRDLAQRFDDTMRYSEDYDLWLRVIWSGLLAFRFPMPLVHRFISPMVAGLSSNLVAMHQGELRAVEHLAKAGAITRPAHVAMRSLLGLKHGRRVLLSSLRRLRLP